MLGPRNALCDLGYCEAGSEGNVDSDYDAFDGGSGCSVHADCNHDEPGIAVHWRSSGAEE